MSARNRRKNSRGDGMKFAYSGPFAPLLDPIRVLPLTKERHAPDSAESYTIGSRLPEHVLVALMTGVGKPKRRRRRRGGGRRVAA